MMTNWKCIRSLFLSTNWCLLDNQQQYGPKIHACADCILSTIIKMYHQQEGMYRSKTHACADRILSIFQPHV